MSDFLTEKERARQVHRDRERARRSRGGRGRGSGGRGRGGRGGRGSEEATLSLDKARAVDEDSDDADDADDDAFDGRATHLPHDLEKLLEQGYTNDSELSAAAQLRTRTGFEVDATFEDVEADAYAPALADVEGADLSLVFRTEIVDALDVMRLGESLARLPGDHLSGDELICLYHTMFDGAERQGRRRPGGTTVGTRLAAAQTTSAAAVVVPEVQPPGVGVVGGAIATSDISVSTAVAGAADEGGNHDRGGSDDDDDDDDDDDIDDWLNTI